MPRQLAEVLQLSVEEVCADFDAMLRHDWRRLGISAEEVYRTSQRASDAPVVLQAPVTTGVERAAGEVARAASTWTTLCSPARTRSLCSTPLRAISEEGFRTSRPRTKDLARMRQGGGNRFGEVDLAGDSEANVLTNNGQGPPSITGRLRSAADGAQAADLVGAEAVSQHRP